MTTILKPSYGSSVPFTTTNLQSLASSSTGVAGWQSAVVDNTANLSMDELVTWVFKTGTSPTVNSVIECWLYEIMDDTPTYPDTINGSEGTVTFTSRNVLLSGAFKFANQVTVDATTNRLYYNSFRLSQAFGLSIPKKWGAIAINFNSGAALFSSGNVVTRTPIQFQNV